MHFPKEYRGHGMKIEYNKNQIQHKMSVLCGFYCIYFLHRTLKFKESPEMALSRFKNVDYNEKFITNYFQQIMIVNLIDQMMPPKNESKIIKANK